MLAFHSRLARAKGPSVLADRLESLAASFAVAGHGVGSARGGCDLRLALIITMALESAAVEAMICILLAGTRLAVRFLYMGSQWLAKAARIQLNLLPAVHPTTLAVNHPKKPANLAPSTKFSLCVKYC